MVPGQGRMPWREIGEALRDIGYQGYVVMEPFINRGGQIGRDIHVWRDIKPDITDEKMDEDAKNAVEFERYIYV